MTFTKIEQLKQLISVTWDGDIIGKETRDELVKAGLAQRHLGYNWLTAKGVEYCETLDFLKS